ncbi:type II secretion system F family protein [bacterium]|nr:type II secretion system F family protein [bacterium]
MVYTHQLSAMVRVQIPIDRALDFLAQGNDRRLNRVFAECSRSVSNGNALSDALRDHPRVFPPIFAPLVQAGENSGALVEVLAALAQYLEQRMHYRKQLQAAITYPLALLGVSFGLMAVLMGVIIPAMRPLFDSLGAPLPWLTQAVLALASAFSQPPLWLGVGLVGITLGVVGHQLLEGDPGSPLRRFLDRSWLSLPVLGRLFHLEMSARVCNCLGMMLNSGLPMERALRDLHEVSGNSWFSLRLKLAADEVLEGHDLSSAMVGLLPSLAIALIINAEAVGNMGSSLLRASLMLREDFENQCQFFTSVLEPVFLVVTSVVVATISLAALLPWISLLSQLGS